MVWVTRHEAMKWHVQHCCRGGLPGLSRFDSIDDSRLLKSIDIKSPERRRSADTLIQCSHDRNVENRAIDFSPRVVECDSIELDFTETQRTAHAHLVKEDVKDRCNGVTSATPTGVKDVRRQGEEGIYCLVNLRRTFGDL